MIDNVYKMKELFPAEKASQLSAENMKLIEEIARRTIFITEHVNAMVEARKVANKNRERARKRPLPITIPSPRCWKRYVIILTSWS